MNGPFGRVEAWYHRHLPRGPAAPEVEYLADAETLNALLARTGPLPVARALAIANQLADALAHCHARGIVHRDVKPSNVMLDGSDHVTLMDFGLVHQEGVTVLTATATWPGSPAYMSPEAVEGEPVGPAGDL